MLTGVALYLMKSGQPALLYLVPCTVLTTVIMAAWTGELGAMWRGHEVGCTPEVWGLNLLGVGGGVCVCVCNGELGAMWRGHEVGCVRV